MSASRVKKYYQILSSNIGIKSVWLPQHNRRKDREVSDEVLVCLIVNIWSTLQDVGQSNQINIIPMQINCRPLNEHSLATTANLAATRFNQLLAHRQNINIVKYSFLTLNGGVQLILVNVTQRVHRGFAMTIHVTWHFDRLQWTYVSLDVWRHFKACEALCNSISLLHTAVNTVLILQCNVINLHVTSAAQLAESTSPSCQQRSVRMPPWTVTNCKQC
jgi:hypothetical protein